MPVRQQTETTCGYCGTGCGLVIETENGRIVRVRGNKKAPVNEGQTCIKGAFGYHYIHSGDRLKKPLIKRNGRFVETTWDSALEAIAEKLTSVRNAYGPESFSMFACARATNEVNYVTQKFTRAVMKTNNIDGCNRTCHAPSVAGLATVFGNGAPTSSIMDIDRADVLLLIGSNTTDAHPIIANRIKKAVKKGLKMIVIDPRKVAMIKFSQLHLQLNVGTDIALMNAMMNIMIEKGWYKEEFVNRTALNFTELKQKVSHYTLEATENITGVHRDDIVEAARLFAGADRGLIAYTLGITEHHCGVNNVFDVANLSLLTGHIGREGTGIMPLRGQNNVQGAGDMGCLPNQLPGGVPLHNETYRKSVEAAWGIPLNPDTGKTQTGILEKMEQGQIKAIYVVGENPIVADVHQNHTAKLFKDLDFLVVQDLFMTETAELADVVLPAKGWAEVEGTYTNTDRRVQRVRPAVHPPGEARDDWDILADLSSRMGFPMHYSKSEEIWNEVRKIAPHLYKGMPYNRLDKEVSLQYPCPDENHPGTALIHQELHAYDSHHKTAPFTPVDYTEPVELPDETYPFTLTTGRRYEPYNTHTQTKYYPDTLKRKNLEETVDMHPDDAARLGIEDGEYVRVASRRGEVTVKSQLTEEVQPALVFMSFHWNEVPTNALTINEFDPIAGTAEYKACAVKIEKI